MRTVDNTADILDSRGVIERLADLTSEREDLTREELEDWTDADEFADLSNFCDDGQQNFSEWNDGVVLVRESYFEQYAMDFADDIGAVDAKAGWPNNCIDWEKAARELQYDYTSIEFDGVTYWGLAG
jgi:hypothetical protein